MTKTKWYQRTGNNTEHLVYLSKEAKELEKMLCGEKTMIIRGAAGRKCPLGGRAKIGDSIYFVENNSDMIVSYKGMIKNVIESDKMTEEESNQFINKYYKELNLSSLQEKRWRGKKYLGLYEIDNISKIEPFKYNRLNNMDDWIITNNIEEIKL